MRGAKGALAKAAEGSDRKRERESTASTRSRGESAIRTAEVNWKKRRRAMPAVAASTNISRPATSLRSRVVEAILNEADQGFRGGKGDDRQDGERSQNDSGDSVTGSDIAGQTDEGEEHQTRQDYAREGSRVLSRGRRLFEIKGLGGSVVEQRVPQDDEAEIGEGQRREEICPQQGTLQEFLRSR